MPIPEEEVRCQNFQPNIFDPSRCFSCLRVKKQHSGVPAQEDSDGLSVVSSYCDVTRDRLGYEDGSLCILSPDCALYICDEEDSTSSTRDQSDYPELSGSITSEEDYPHLQDAESQSAMTRLDPPPHRPNPRAWMDEPRGRENFSRHSGSKEERERESGYFSLGRASGIRTPREKSPPPPFRHAEAGRPLPSTRSPEPKATIPFRNPDLGVPSQRRGTDVQSPDAPPISSSPPLCSESECRQGPRCLSPTPFKIAESLESSNRRSVDRPYSRGHTTSHSLSQHQQTGRSSSMQRGSSSLSRAASPSRSTSPFRRTEPSGSSHRQNFDSAAFSQRSSQRSRSPTQTSYGRDVDSGGLHRNLKAAVSTVASRVQSSSFEHLKNSLNATGAKALSIRQKRSASPVRDGYGSPDQTLLCKTETGMFSNGVSRDRHSFSPSRRGYDSPSQSPLRKTEPNASFNNCVRDSRSSSPSRRGYDPPSQSLLRKTESNPSSSNHRVRDSRSPSPSRRGYDPPSQSLLRKTESNPSSNNRVRDSRSSSPSRRGYDPPSQSLLRKTESNPSSNNRVRDSRSSSPSRRGYDPPSQSLLRKTESNPSSNNRVRDSRSSSPSRRGYDPPSQSLLRKTESNPSSNNRVRDSRSSSPSRRGLDPPSQSLLRKAETIASSNYRGLDSRSSSPSRKSYEPPNQSLLHKMDTNVSSKNRGCDSRSSSPSRRGYEPASQSSRRKTETNAPSDYHVSDPHSSSLSRKGYDMPLLKNTTNGTPRSNSSYLKNDCSQARADTNPAYMRKANHKDPRSDPSTSPGSWRGSARSLRSPPTSRSSSPPRRNKGADIPNNSLKYSSQSANRSSSRSRSNGRRSLEARSPSPEYRRSSIRNRSPSPQRRRHASSQSSLSESESSHVSGGSGAAGFNKEEYAMMADLPKVKTIFEREGSGQPRRAQSRSPEREGRYKPASHSRERHSYWEHDESGVQGRWNDKERNGLDGVDRLSQSHSSTSAHTQVPSLN